MYRGASSWGGPHVVSDKSAPRTHWLRNTPPRKPAPSSPCDTAPPPDLLAFAEDSLGSALALARQLPGQKEESVAKVACRAFGTGMGPAMTAGIGVTAVGIVIALLIAPRARTSPTTDPPHGRAARMEESS